MHAMKHFRLIFIIILYIIVQYPAISQKTASPETPSPENRYFLLKEAGRYGEAIDIMQIWNRELEDPIAIEINLFQLQELMVYPELHAKGLETLAAMLSSKAAAGNRFVQDRIDIIKNRLYLNKGDIRTSKSIVDSLSFLNFHVMGPYNRRSVAEFDRSYPPEQSFDEGRTANGSDYPVSWFKAETDRTGTIDLNDLFTETRHTFYYLYNRIYLARGGEYIFILGKTGKTDLWLDGTRIFSNRSEHGFCHDQYFISVHLPEGFHRVLIKAGNSHEGVKISLRLAVLSGARVGTALPAGFSQKESAGTLRGIAYFPSLATLLIRKNPSPDDQFAIGYLLYMTRLGGRDSGIVKYLSDVPEHHSRHSSACYYLARAERDPDTKDSLLRRSRNSNPDNLEALRELAAVKIRHGFLYEAFPLISTMNAADQLSPWYLASMTRFFIKKRWIPEALRYAELLKKSPFPSLGNRYEAKIYTSDNDYFHALPDLEYLLDQDRWNRSNYTKLLSCYENSGKYGSAIHKLHQAVIMYPSCIAFKLRLARLIENQEGTSAALPYLSAALKTSPNNKHALSALGNAYYNLGKIDLAVYYLDLSLQFDPGNLALRQRLAIIKNEEQQKF